MSNPNAPRASDRTGWLRESVASVIAFGDLGGRVVAADRTFFSSSGIDHRIDVLQLGLPMFGVVLGYYFGRVPAERRADSADSRSQTLQESLDDCSELRAKQEVELELRRNGAIPKQNDG